MPLRNRSKTKSKTESKKTAGELSERCRADLIEQLAALVHNGELSDEAREASLTLIGWLARRRPGDCTPRHGMRARALARMCERALTRALARLPVRTRVHALTILVARRRSLARACTRRLARVCAPAHTLKHSLSQP